MTAVLEEKKKKILEKKRKLGFQEKQIREKERKLRVKKRIEKGTLLEKIGLLELEDSVILGALLEMKKKLKDPKIESQWKQSGEDFLKTYRQNNNSLLIIRLKEENVEVEKILKSFRFRWNKFRKEWYGEVKKDEIAKALENFEAKIEIADIHE